MARPFNENLLRTLRLTNEMLALADEGDRDRDDSSCAIIYGLMRDMAYRLRRITEEECEKHRRIGLWDEEAATGSDGNERTAPPALAPRRPTEASGEGGRNDGDEKSACEKNRDSTAT